MQHIAGRGEHIEHGGEGLGVLTAQNACQRLALCRRGALVDDVDAFALAFVNRPRPAEDPRGAQGLKPCSAEKTLLDIVDGQSAAVAVARAGVELARAAIVAVAVAEFASLDLPRYHPLPPWRFAAPRTV
jgi:hypothetical protein